MFRLNGNDRGAAVGVIEEPREAVNRLGRIDTSDPALTEALASLGQDQLRDLARHTKAALRQARKTAGGNGSSGVQRSASSVSRARRTTD